MAEKAKVGRPKDTEEVRSIKDLTKTMVAQGKDRRKESKELDKRMTALDKMKKEIEDQGGDAEKNKEYSKELLKIQRRQFQLSLKTMSPSARKEAIKEQAGKDKSQLTALQRISTGIRGFGKGMFKAAATRVKGLGGILKKVALVALIPLLIKFFNSESWEKIKNMVKDHLFPALEKLWNKVLLPLGKWFGKKTLFHNFSNAGNK
jgi:hypothetical protein